jgi:hypothetical protein
MSLANCVCSLPNNRKIMFSCSRAYIGLWRARQRQTNENGLAIRVPFRATSAVGAVANTQCRPPQHEIGMPLHLATSCRKSAIIGRKTNTVLQVAQVSNRPFLESSALPDDTRSRCWRGRDTRTLSLLVRSMDIATCASLLETTFQTHIHQTQIGYP